MLKSKIIKFFALVLTFLLTLALTSCGKYSKFYSTTESLQIEASLPLAKSGAATTEEAEKDIILQQSSLCLAYDEAYRITESELYDEYSAIPEDKRLAALSKARNALNAKSEAEFTNNLRTILAEVTDCPNVSAYIAKRIEETKNFYVNYIKLQSYTAEDFVDVTSIFLNFYESKNVFARSVLKDKEKLICECATLSIEENAKVSSGHSASLQKNNNIVIALNEFYGGVRGNSDYAIRISNANKILSSYVKELNDIRNEKLSELETHK